jgi:hypothetical protein
MFSSFKNVSGATKAGIIGLLLTAFTAMSCRSTRGGGCPMNQGYSGYHSNGPRR